MLLSEETQAAELVPISSIVPEVMIAYEQSDKVKRGVNDFFLRILFFLSYVPFLEKLLPCKSHFLYLNFSTTFREKTTNARTSGTYFYPFLTRVSHFCCSFYRLLVTCQVIQQHTIR